MKLTFLFSFLVFTGAWANSYSQTTKLSLNLKNVTVQELIQEIEGQTDFYFLYQDEIFKKGQRVTIHVKNESLDSILKQFEEQASIKAEITDHQIILKKKINNEGLVLQQQKTVLGVVTDQKGEPLPGVSVIVKGTTTGVVTGVDGKFQLEIPSSTQSLQFSFIGMKTQEVSIAGKTIINVIMEEESIGLEEVVAIGYGVQKKTTITGAISTIKGEDLAKIPVPNISQALAGKLAGVSMRPNGGQPGFDDPDIHIRGIVTTGNNAPLIVIDGVQRDNIRQINPNIIESITILKDASAVAPYGIGGANGVILITTKTGVAGKPIVRLNSSYGIQTPTYLPNMLGAQDYMALQNEGYYNIVLGGTTPPNDPDIVSNYNQLHKDDPWRYPDSDFVDAFNLNAPVQNHNVELSGGNEMINYNAGLGYYDQSGIFDNVSYTRYSYNLSFNMKATKTTKVGISLIGSEEITNEIDPAETVSGHLFREFYKFIPTQSLVYPEGDKWGESSSSSPIGALRGDGYNLIRRNTLLTSVSIEQELPFIKGLSAKGVFSYDPTQQNTKSWHIPIMYYKINLDADPYTYEEAISNQEGGSEPFAWLNLENRRWFRYTYQAYLNYSGTFGDHSVTGLLVAEGRNSSYDNFFTRRNNFAIQIDEMDFGSSDKLDYDNGGSSSTGSEIGYVYRLGYSFKDKYMLEAAGRYDGHYYFAPGKRWGYFPSFSAAWRISEEAFMGDISSIDNLKLRGSWGKSGMLAGSAFQYLAGYVLRGNAYAYGNGTLVQGSRVEQEANPEITWEISTKANVGIDLNMWNGLLNLELDLFHEKRTGMLLAPQVTLPLEYGLSLSQENKGSMDNNGIEINIGTRKTFSNDLEFDLSANFSYAMNNMIEVFQTDAQANNPNRTRVGQPYGTPFGYKALGLFTTDEDINGDGIINSEDGYNIEQFGDLHPGDVKYADLSGLGGQPDGKIDANDNIAIGHPVYPLMTFGLTPTINWKNFDASFFFQGSAMSSIRIFQFMTQPFENNGSNTAYEYMDNRWTVDTQDAKYPRATPSPYANNTKESDFWMVNTSFLRLKTASIGYTLPKMITNKLQIADVRLYVTGQNVLTFSKIKHVDPEMGYDLRETAYPLMRSTTFGIDITF